MFSLVFFVGTAGFFPTDTRGLAVNLQWSRRLFSMDSPLNFFIFAAGSLTAENFWKLKKNHGDLKSQQFRHTFLTKATNLRIYNEPLANP